MAAETKSTYTHTPPARSHFSASRAGKGQSTVLQTPSVPTMHTPSHGSIGVKPVGNKK